MPSSKHHHSQNSSWLRAAVLGANDGIVSTTSLIIGVAAAQSTQSEVVLVAVAGWVAGAMSMAAGEYVSVSSQADAEAADLALERESLITNRSEEQRELVDIYIARGLTPSLAEQVAQQLMQRDALAAHARDELGISERTTPRPLQAAGTSAVAFSLGAFMPLSVAILVAPEHLITVLAPMSLLFLATLGAFAARVGGASIAKAALRVTFWGALAMTLTALIGSWFGAEG